MPRAYIPQRLEPSLSRKISRSQRPLDERIDHEPHTLLNVDNSKYQTHISPCKTAPTCFECPLSDCKFNFSQAIRNAIVFALPTKDVILRAGRLLAQGNTPYAVAKILGIELNRVYRWRRHKIWTYFKEWESLQDAPDVPYAPHRDVDQYMVGEPQMPRI